MSSSTRVQRLPLVVPTGVKIGEPVSQSEWQTLGLAANRILGRGNVLLPAHNPNLTGATASRVYRIKPTYWAVARVWVVTVGPGSSTSWTNPEFLGTLTCGGVSPASIAIGNNSYNVANTYTLIEECTKTASAVDLTVTLSLSSGAAQIYSVACYELPRSEVVANAANFGADLSSVSPSQPIYTADYRSTKGVSYAIGLTAAARRGLLAWQGSATTTSGTFVDIMPFAMPALPAKIGPADTTASCEAQIRARVSAAGTAGEVRIVRADGTASSAISVVTAPPVYGFHAPTLSFKCEDLAQASGLPSGSWETCQLQARRTSGAGNIEIVGLTLYQL